MSDVGEYCREVEDCLTRVNGGHLVRIVGPAFEIVRGWALEGIPLSIVRRAIELKAARHRLGTAKRPLRIEFCEADVRSIFDNWRRAVGVASQVADEETPTEDQQVAESRRPSLGKHVERVRDHLVRAAGRLDLPESLRDELSHLIDEVTTIGQSAKGARGDARAAIVTRLAELDRELADHARRNAPPEVLGELREEAARDLGTYRSRLDGSAWQRAVDVTVDRLLRQRFTLPSI